jgi:ATP-dependent DNA helicase RecQ
MNGEKIAFCDIEVNTTSKNIDKLGLLIGSVKIAETSITKIKDVFLQLNPKYICGHNFVDHDKIYLSSTSFNPIFSKVIILDTLFLSMLLFPNKKTHKLDKPYKTELSIENQPLGDAEQTKELFLLLDKKFDILPFELKAIYTHLLHNSDYFQGYFIYKNFVDAKVDLYEIIKDKIISDQDTLESIYRFYPVELAFAIAFLYSDKEASISSVILMRFPKVVEILQILTFDKKSLHVEDFAQKEFNIPSFREFEAQEKELEQASLFEQKPLQLYKISQKDIILNALEGNSLLAILPTGGGKTFTFQLPALIKAKAYKGLTVVISPLQALMKNHVDSFKEKNQNFRVVAISGYLSPVERMNTITEIENGVVDILYLAPEALRSNSIFKALKKRVIERFVIDEAHCFSSWGHDFRHDYYFIADTIKELENSSPFQAKIPVSCFTATAKPEVLEDIKRYFKERLDIELKEFIASTKRYNLKYRAIEVEDKRAKYEVLIKELIELGKQPTIIYIPQNARACRELSEKLQADERLEELDLEIEPFYAKIDQEIEDGFREGRNKSEILQDFIENKIDIVIATTAFGMGIDKPDIQAVIHYEQSDSLEAYLQESGRGARNEKLEAQCIVIYSKEDFDKTFAQLNHSKVEFHEIARIVKELKDMKREEIYISPKELAQKMGIDTEDSKIDYEVIIKTALLELEQANILKRGRNSTKIFATSVDSEKRNMEYIHKVLDSKKEDVYKEIYQAMIEVMQNIIQRSKVDAIEVEDLADIIGIERRKMFEVLYALQAEQLIDFHNDISIYIKNTVKKEFEKHFKLEEAILDFFMHLSEFTTSVNIREINSTINEKNFSKEIKKIIQSWSHLSKLKANIFNAYFTKDICRFEMNLENLRILSKLIETRKKTCEFIVEQVLTKLENKEEAEVEVSTNKLKHELESFQKLTLEGFHHSLVYLHEMLKDFQLRRGRLIYYQTFHLDKQEDIKKPRPYQKRKHYDKSLKLYYERKIEAIHIQISFLKRLIKDGWEKTIGFVQDYFGMEYTKFKRKYGFVDKEIKLPITQEKLAKILQDLNEEQKKIFEDKKSDSIMVLAGPGSGKTKTLVHKIASLITKENKKPEYFLMLAHSRVAVAEFKERLLKLIGTQVYDMKILTFHAFALQLIGKKVDQNTKLSDIIELATQMLNDDVIKLPYIQMLALDEYQDVGEKAYSFIKAIYTNMSKEKKIIAVGDDDQCINNFGNDKADIKYIQEFKSDFEEEIEDEEGEDNLFQVKKSTFSEYSLLTNYRSKQNLVAFANEFSRYLPQRLKNAKLISKSNENGAIEITFYEENSNYIENVVDAIKNDSESLSIAILTRTNDEVLQIYSALSEEGIKARYITSKDGFELGSLVELRDFLRFWEKSSFDEAMQSLEDKYMQSKNYLLTCEVINRFYDEYTDEIEKSSNHFQALFKEFLEEIEFDEFEQSRTRITVSTMHKAKGKEFDTVFVCTEDNFIKNQYDARLLYVAITRAKEKLYIHTKDRFFTRFENFSDEVNYCTQISEDSTQVVFLMGLGDISLANEYAQKGISKVFPRAGEKIEIIQKQDNVFELRKNDWCVGTLAKAFGETKGERVSTKIVQLQQKRYKLVNEAEIEYVVEWCNKTDKKIYQEVLCKVVMKKEVKDE